MNIPQDHGRSVSHATRKVAGDGSATARDSFSNTETSNQEQPATEQCPFNHHCSLLETTIAELQATNQDLVASNAKLHTVNEELHTLNAEAQLEVQRRDEFLAMLSHELRNPLGAISSAAKILACQQLSPSIAAASADVISRQSKQMARLLDDLLDVSRVTHGKIDIRQEVVELTSLVDDAVQAVQAEIERRNHTLTVTTPDQPIWVAGDSARLLQVQGNLLMNAAKYTPDGGQIFLSVSQQNGDAVVRVTDNGRGIPAELLPAVFDLFVQAEKPLERSEGGMGVGLSLVRMLVALHGGSVTAQSEGENQGSTFTVRIPLTSQKPTSNTYQPTVASDQTTRVLIIEDNDDSRHMLQELLQLDGYPVQVASDGESGYQALQDNTIDVALVDIGLPKMDGYQLARKVRTQLAEQPIRLVALTGYGRAADHQKVLEAGFDEHLVKPVAAEDLAHALRKPR